MLKHGRLQAAPTGASEIRPFPAFAQAKRALARAALLLAGALLPASSALATSPEVAGWCDQMGGRLRSVSAQSCRGQDFVVMPFRTEHGNFLARRDIPPAKGAQAAKRVLVIGGIHGDELTSVSTVFRWLEWIRAPEAQRYFWRVIPAANPDGLLARRSTRVNANGVDLNRNFESHDWKQDAGAYWARRTGSDPRRYPGKEAASEVETRWLQQEIEAFQPDLIVSVHAPYNLLDYDGPVPQPMRFGRLSLNRLGVYPGSLGNYAGLNLRIPVITIELPHATVMPTMRDQQAIWEDMLHWMKRNIREAAR